MSDLYRLVYASKNLIAGTDGDVAAAVAQILEASQRNNAKADVTGALMFNAGAFAQVLEGPQRGVEATFERIQCDDRHSDVTVLQCGPAEQRSFTNWSMAFVGQSVGGQAQFSRLAAESGFDLSRLDGDAVFAMLHGLVLEEEGMALPDVSAAPAKPAEAHETIGLDVDQLREEIAQLRPDRATPPIVPTTAAQRADVGESGGQRSDLGKDMKRTAKGATDSALCVLKAALASERQRTSELRSEIDALQIALASREDQHDAMREERNLWAERARLLAMAMSQEAGHVQKADPGLAPSDTRLDERARSGSFAGILAA